MGRTPGASPLAVVAALVALSGCSGGSSSAGSTSPPASSGARTATIPAPGSSPSASAGTERDQAYRNAQQAYTRFLAVFDDVLEDGGRKPERLRTAAAGRALVYTQNVAADFRKNGYTSVGTTTILSVKPVKLTRAKGGSATVMLTSCEDGRTARALDKNGKPLAKVPGTPDFLRYEVIVAAADPRAASSWIVSDLSNEAAPSCP